MTDKHTKSLSDSKGTALPLWRQIRWNLVVYTVLLATLPIAAVTAITLPRRSAQDTTQVTGQLESIAQLKADQITEWLQQGMLGIELLLADPDRYGQFLALAESPAVDSNLQSDINSLLAGLIAAHPSYETFFIYNTQGEILAASNPADLGKRVNRKPYFSQSLTTAAYVQPPFYEIGSRELGLFITHPLIEQGETVGVFAASIELETMGEIMTEAIGGFPATGETYLVSSQTNYLLTPSRFEGYLLTQAYHSDGIDQALAGRNGSGTYDSYRDTNVIGAYRWVPDLQAALVAEVEQEEALAASSEARDANILIAGAAALIAAVSGFYYASWVAKPITTLTRASLAISKGDYNQRVNVTVSNEIGQLTAAFNTMAAELQQHISDLQQLNEELEARVAARTRDIEVASDVSRQITQVLDVRLLLPQLVELTRRSFNLYHVSVFIYDPATNLLHLEAGTGEAGKQMLEAGKHFLIDAHGLVPLAARTREPIAIDDVQTSANHFANPLLPDTHSETAIPMVIGTQLIGVLDLQATEIGRFTTQDIAVFGTLAEQIAIAVRNAQLFSEAQVARDEAEQSNQVKSMFLASMSHELRTPLNSVINFTQFVAKGVMGPVTERQEQTLKTVIKSAKHLLGLINDVLDMSKIESGTLNLFVEPDVNVNEIIQTATSTARGLLEDKPVELRIEAEDNLPTIVGDKQRILQILLNIVSNACKFTREGHITIRAFRQNGSIELAVSDTGPGIAPEDQDDVFEPFKQTDTGLRQGGGTGLGMPITRSLTEAHGGHIRLESALGKGATFWVSLPIKSDKLTVTLN